MGVTSKFVLTEPLYKLRIYAKHKFVLSSQLIVKTLRQLKLARAAIIYLSLAVHVEEGGVKTKGKLCVPMSFDHGTMTGSGRIRVSRFPSAGLHSHCLR